MPHPNLIVPGASRSGTTFLFYLLSQHPDIFTTELKELYFFGNDCNYNKGIENYKNNFSNTENYKIKIESSPPYFHKGIRKGSNNEHIFNPTEDSAIRIQKYFPDIKLIFTLRNPINRLYSQYWKNYFQKREKLTLHRALEEEYKQIRNKHNSTYCWIYKNHYSIHLNHWFSLFPKENIKVIIFEEWTKNKVIINEELMDFLGLKRFNFNFQNAPKNSGIEIAKRLKNIFSFRRKQYKQITSKEYKLISSYIGEDISKVEIILNRKLDIWKTIN